MNIKDKKPVRTFGLMLYLLGAVVGFLLLTMSVWGDLEAGSFGATLRSEEKLNTLNCPIFITKDEIGMISAVFENRTDRDAAPLVRSTITFGFVTLVDEQEQRVEIPAGESSQMNWYVSQDNAAYGRLILAHIYQLSNRSVPSRQASCGIVVLPFSGPTGQQVFVGSFVSSMIFITVGIGLFAPKDILQVESMNAEKKRLRSMIRSFIFLGTYFLVATLLSMVGNFMLGIVLMAFAGISAIAVFAIALSSN